MNLSLRLRNSINEKKNQPQKKPLSVKDIVIIGMMTAALVTVHVALSFLPNIELITLLIIVFTLVFGWRTLFVIFAFIFVEGLIYGFGLWWFSWLYIWPVLFAIAMLFKKCRSVFFWAMFACIFGLCFGALSAIQTVVISGLYAGVAYWIQGIPFDIVHGISNFILTLLLFYPLYFVMNKVYRQFFGDDRHYS